jgi:hypothetical protein
MAIVQGLGALLAGFLMIAAIVGITTAALMKLAPRWVGAQGGSSLRYVSVNLFYSLVAAISGGYITAWIAHDSSLRYAFALALVVLLLGGLSALQARGRQPIWYQLMLLAIMPIGEVLGGLLRMRLSGPI